MKIYDKEGTLILDIAVDDNSYRYRAIMGEHSLTLYYSLAEHVEIPLGAYCDYQGERYTLERPEALNMQHSRMFNYTVTMEAVEVLAKRWKFRNPVDGRLKFTLTAKPHEHLQMFVDNMNARDGGWTVGDCVTGVETMISYDHAYCSDALAQMAAEFKTEYEFNGKRVSLRKLEYNKDNPLPLSYGKGNGFKSGVGRTNEGDTPPIEILYTQGGSDNIDPSKYGSTELLLPKGQTLAYDGDRFEGEDGFDAANARTYATDEAGMSIRRSDKAQSTLTEDSLDCTSIYPKRVGTVSAVVTVDAEKNFYDFTDASIPQALDYEACLIAGETMTVIFQSGMLAGREFDVKYYHEAVTEEDGTSKAARRFEIVPQEIDGQTMPNGTFCPRPGDTYAVFHCMLPDAYICDNATKSGASWDMFRAGVKYLFDNEEVKFSFTGELDGIWSKKDWVNIGGKIKLGGYILFSDPRFQPEGVRVRITGVKDYINKPYSPVIELSNTTVTGGVSSTLKDLVSQEVVNEDRHKEALSYTKRRWRDVMETLTMMFDPEGDYFTNLIKPLAVHTAQLIVGTNSQQMDFVGVRFIPNKGGNANLFAATAGKLVHFTISEDGVREWTIPATADIALREEEAYYVYAKCPRTGTEGQIICSTQQIKLEDDPAYYHFLVGILNTPYDGSRSWNPSYGYTEISGETITTGVIKDKNGTFAINLNDGTITGWGSMTDKPDMTQYATVSWANGEFKTFVKGTDYNGETIVSYINQTADTIKINASHISLQGAVSFDSFSTSLVNTWNQMSNDVSTANTNASNAQKDAAAAIKSANTAITDATNAWNKAVSAATDASTAVTNAATAKQNAATAITNAASAVEKAGSVEGALNKLPSWSKEASIIKALESATVIVNGYISTSFIDVSNLNITNALSIGNFTWDGSVLKGSGNAAIQVSGGLGYLGETYEHGNKLCYGYFSSLSADTLYTYGITLDGNLTISGTISSCTFTGNVSIGAGGSGYYQLKLYNSSNTLSWFIRTDNGMYLSFDGGTRNHKAGFQLSSGVCNLWISGSLTQGSDIRIKNRGEDVTGVLDKIAGLRAFRYTLKDNEEGKLFIGFSAQEVQEVFPEFVSSTYYNEDFGNILTLDYPMLGAMVAIEGCNELHAKVKALEERVAELEK